MRANHGFLQEMAGAVHGKALAALKPPASFVLGGAGGINFWFPGDG